VTWRLLDGPAGALRTYATAADADAPPGSVLVLAHELPLIKNGAADTARTFPALADRLAEESGWRVVTAALRGAGGSEGDFSAEGWLEDLAFVMDHERDPTSRFSLAGFGLGGALALHLAAADQRVRSVACLGTPDDVSGYGADPEALLARCRYSGVVRTPGFPADPVAWAAQLSALQPLEDAERLGDRALLVLHGAADGEVPVAAGRALAEAAGAEAELRVVPGAGHWLRADPRVVATLIGWLERQR